jgi:hypothetical protein
MPPDRQARRVSTNLLTSLLPGSGPAELIELAAVAERQLAQVESLCAELAPNTSVPTPECGRLAWRSEAAARYEAGLVRLGGHLMDATRSAAAGCEALHLQLVHLRALAEAAAVVARASHG